MQTSTASERRVFPAPVEKRAGWVMTAVKAHAISLIIFVKTERLSDYDEWCLCSSSRESWVGCLISSCLVQAGTRLAMWMKLVPAGAYGIPRLRWR